MRPPATIILLNGVRVRDFIAHHAPTAFGLLRQSPPPLP